MKKLMLILSAMLSLPLVGCSITDSLNPIDSNVKLLKNEQGETIYNCSGSTIPYRNEGVIDFWKENNLPNGTTEFVCKNGKAYLPNDVTDCQGSNISKQVGGLARFKEINNLNKLGNLKFTCQNGKAVQWYK